MRDLNWLELVGETMRHALEVLATVSPDWLRQHLLPEWVERYQHRIENYRLPSSKAARQRYGEQIGSDGWYLLDAVDAEHELRWLCEVPAAHTLRTIWEQQFQRTPRGVQWQAAEHLDSARERLQSPYDPDARYSRKEAMSWVGYKLFVTETCDDDLPRLITDVRVTPAPESDISQAVPIQHHLTERDLTPGEHFLDGGFVDAETVRRSQQTGRSPLSLRCATTPVGKHALARVMERRRFTSTGNSID